MRTLRFIVKGQKITKAPGCDFSGLVRGSRGYLKAAFEFDAAWNGCKKAASFFRGGVTEYAAPIIGGVCEIPFEALDRSVFDVSVTGVKQGYNIKTNKVRVKQE